MLKWIYLPILACVLLAFSSARSEDKKDADKDLSETKVSFRLNAIETAKLMEHYEGLVKRELGLQDSVRACNKSRDVRLPEYERALQEAQNDLEQTKKKLVALESEKVKLSKRLGKEDLRESSPDEIDKTSRMLEKILERLSNIEKRLEKLERQK